MRERERVKSHKKRRGDENREEDREERAWEQMRSEKRKQNYQTTLVAISETAIKR